MTDSIRERLLAAFFTNLSGISGVKAYRNRDTEVAAENLPAVVQRDGGMTRDYDGTALLNVTLGVDIECYVSAVADDTLGAAVSDLYAKVTLAALADRTLGGLATDVLEAEQMMGDPVIARDASDKPHAAFLLSFAVSFFLKPGDPYSSAP